VQSLQKYPIEEVLNDPRFFTEWNPDLINELAKYLVPEKIRVHIVAKAFEKDANSVEHWYETKYKKEKIPKELIDRWNNTGFNDAFHLPEKNEFIPSKFDIKPNEKVYLFKYYKIVLVI
jgi:insulysin